MQKALRDTDLEKVTDGVRIGRAMFPVRRIYYSKTMFLGVPYTNHLNGTPVVNRWVSLSF